MSSFEDNYVKTLDALKQKIKLARYRATISVARHMLQLYWDIGNTILEKQKAEGWGTKVIDNLSSDLKKEFPELNGLSVRNLKYMRAFAEAYPTFLRESLHSLTNENQQTDNQHDKIVQVDLAQISWYHHITLLEKVKEPEIRIFYIGETIKNGWSRNILVHQIEGELHKRIGQISNNFKTAIDPAQSELVQQLFKDPYKLEFIYLGKEAKEKDLEDALMSQLTKFLLELGQYFAFLGRQYKMVVDGKEYYYDLLFYHTRLKRYIVIDLKIDEFQPEYKGKMEFYLSIADEKLKQDDDEKSIGLILCKTKNGVVVEYALRDSSKPIGIAEYELGKSLPDSIRGDLPSIEEIEAQIEKDYQQYKSPSEKKFEALKDKIFKMQRAELEQKASTKVLASIFETSILPLYRSVITRFQSFADLFVSLSHSWSGHNISFNAIEKLTEEAKQENFFSENHTLKFCYRLDGFRKAGTEAFSVFSNMDIIFDPYWYSFSFSNFGGHGPFLKKLYHDPLTKEEISNLTDQAFDLVIAEIDSRIDNLLV